MNRTAAQVLIIAHPRLLGTLLEVLEVHCTVRQVRSAAEGLKAIRALPPTLLLAGDEAVTLAEARELKAAAAAPLVLLTAERTPTALERLRDEAEADAVLCRPFTAQAIAEAVTAALGGTEAPKAKAQRERRRAARKAERDRWARIALLPLGQLLALEHPVKDAEEGLTSLVRRIGQHDFQKEPLRTAAAALDLCLVTILWDLRLAQFCDRSEGNLWERTAQALEHTGFKKEAVSLRRAVYLLEPAGGLAEPWDRLEARAALEGPARKRWDQLAAVVDRCAWQPASVRKLLAYARLHLKKLSRVDARG